jgi:outer membrane protein OmpA-like peptidoglycan-associated protein
MRRALVIVPLLLAVVMHAQQDVYLAKLSLQGGLVRSVGDITSDLETFDPERTAMLGLSYERFLSYGVALYGGYEYLRLSGNDRETGSLDRSLNFMTEVNTAQLGLRFYADNGRLLNFDARFAPFVQLGVGAGIYDVYGDLYARDGRRYNYWSDGTLRTLPESSPDAANAQVMEQDGVFETRLTQRATEDGKPQGPWFVFIPARIGLKWRICDRFSAELAYAFNWTFTDHLDDVSGDYPTSFATEELAYLSNPAGHTGTRGNDGLNDHFHHLSLGLSMGIGRRASRYRMPPVRIKPHAAKESPRPFADPDPIRRTSLPPAERDTAQLKWTVNVESIRIARLEVDAIVVRGARAEEMDTTSALLDTLKRSSAIPDNKLQQSDTTVMMSGNTAQLNSSLDSLQVKSLADSLEQRSSVDTLKRMPPMDMLRVIPSRDTLERRSPVEPTLRSNKEQAPYSVVEPKAQGVQPTDGGDAEIGVTDEQPALDKDSHSSNAPSSTKTGGGTTERITTERIIERTAVPVMVIQKEVVRDTVVKEVLVPDTAARRSDITEVVSPETASRKSAPAKVRTEPSAPVRIGLETQRHETLEINAVLHERILTLERYISVQEDGADSAVLIDSLRQRIAALDKQLAASRAKATERAEIPEERPLLNDSVHFTSESFMVDPASSEELEAIAKRIIAQDVKVVLVTGHTDRSGDAQYNLDLSQRRAEAVAEVLRAAGVPSERMKVKGLGQELAQQRHDRQERVVVVQAVPEK